jgi:hypothetical protein
LLIASWRDWRWDSSPVTGRLRGDRGGEDLGAAGAGVVPDGLETYISRLLTKLDARDRAQLVMIAYETRLVTPA